MQTQERRRCPSHKARSLAAQGRHAVGRPGRSVCCPSYYEQRESSACINNARGSSCVRRTIVIRCFVRAACDIDQQRKRFYVGRVPHSIRSFLPCRIPRARLARVAAAATDVAIKVNCLSVYVLNSCARPNNGRPITLHGLSICSYYRLYNLH